MVKKHDHSFEMMVIVAIIAIVGFVMMFMNSSNDNLFRSSKCNKVKFLNFN